VINFTKAREHLENGPPDDATNAYLADQWCWYLASTYQHLDRRRRSRRLTTEVWQPWHDLLAAYYPLVAAGAGVHRHVPATSDQSSPALRQVR